MRIGIARIWQETNTFSPEETTRERFALGGVYAAGELLSRLDQLPELSGAAAAARAHPGNVELVPIMAAMAWPAGRLTPDCFQYLTDLFLQNLDRCGSLDGLMLSLHGALAAEGCDDVEGALLSRLREHRGRALPVAVSLDLHANITRRMAELADIMVGYHTCPHLDVEQTGQRAMEILLQTVSGSVTPEIAWRKIPMIVPADRQNHAVGPLRELLEEVGKIEAMPGILSCSLFAVQPWLDVAELGWSTLVVSHRPGTQGQRLADTLALGCWQRRESFFVEKLSPAAAVREALRTNGRPVVISDSADSTNSGAPGNSTSLLTALIDAGVTEPVFLPMVGRNAALAAHEAGVGATIDAVFGCQPKNPYSRPLRLAVRVASLHDGAVRVSGHLGRNLQLRMGKTAVLEAGSIRIVASCSAAPGHVPPEFFQQLGLDVRDAKIIVVKSPVGFRASYEPVAAGIILCEAPGPARSDLCSLDYTRRPRPLFPFEPCAGWVPAETRRMPA